MGPEVFDDAEVRLGSGKTLQFSRLYLFQKSSSLLLYRFGKPWPDLLPWPAPGQHKRYVGYLQAGQDWESVALLELDIAEIIAGRRSFTRKLTDIAVVRSSLDSAGHLRVKFVAAQCNTSMGDTPETAVAPRTTESNEST